MFAAKELSPSEDVGVEPRFRGSTPSRMTSARFPLPGRSPGTCALRHRAVRGDHAEPTAVRAAAGQVVALGVLLPEDDPLPIRRERTRERIRVAVRVVGEGPTMRPVWVHGPQVP